MLKGIDISEFQSPSAINYDKIAKQIDFVILRVGYTGWGTGTSLNADKAFEKHYAEFSKRNIPIGVYWYSCANEKVEGVHEAEKVLALIKGKTIKYPIYWDTEDNHHQRPTSKQVLTDTAKAFCERIKSAGYRVGVYASTSWLMNELDMRQLEAYETWVAHYGVVKPSYTGKYGIWQYTSVGHLDGYIGNLDLNYCYTDYAPKPIPVPIPTPKPVSIYYPIPKYTGTSIVDALKSAGVKYYYGLGGKIAKANGIRFYVGTSKQNTLMLTLLRAGKLKRV